MEYLVGLSGGIVAIAICFSGGLIGYGRLKESMITRQECRDEQKICQGEICIKIDELKNLFLSLHSENLGKIDSSKQLMNSEFKSIAKSIGRIEGKFNV